MLQHTLNIDLLVTIDVANGPWPHKIDCTIPQNVRKNIDVYQSVPNFPLCSYGAHTIAVSTDSIIENINLTKQKIRGIKVSHSAIEQLMVKEVIMWIKKYIEAMKQDSSV